MDLFLERHILQKKWIMTRFELRALDVKGDHYANY